MQYFITNSWGSKSIVITRGRIKRLSYCFGQHKQQDKQKHYMCLNINSYQSAKDRQCNNTYCGMFHAEKVNKVKQTNQKATQNNKLLSSVLLTFSSNKEHFPIISFVSVTTKKQTEPCSNDMFVQSKTVAVHKVKPQNGQANNVHGDLKNPKCQSHD